MQFPNLSRTAIPKPLGDFLRQVSLRRRWQQGVHLGLPTLGLGLGLTLALVWLGRTYPLAQPFVLLLAGLGLTLVGLLAMLAYVWLRPHAPSILARQLDGHFRLEDRVSTAVDLAVVDRQTPVNIIAGQLADTLRHLEHLDPAQLFPIRLSWRWLALNGILIMSIAVGLLTPNPQVQVLQRQAKNREIIAKQKDQLEEIRAELLANEALQQIPEGDSSLRTLDEVLETLQDEEALGPEEALAALSEAEQALSGLQNALDQRAASLNDLAQTINQFDASGDLAEAVEQRDRTRAAEFLQAAANNPPHDPNTSRNLANSLRQAAQSAAQRDNTALAESLGQAAEALEQAAEQGANSPAAQESLRQAAEALSDAEQQLANQDALEQALGNIQEARQQLAEAAGPADAGQEQQAGQGQAPQRGQGQGPGGFPGEDGGGAGPADPGRGADGLYADEGAPEELPTDNGPGQDRLGSYEPEYPPIHWGGEGGPIVNPAPQGAEGGLPIGAAPIDPNQEPNPALVPYNQVYGRYADAAGEALDDTYIPLGMKNFVRNYFGALEPGGD